MGEWKDPVYPSDKRAMYTLLLNQLDELTMGEREPIPNLANGSALLNGALSHINWVGWYIAQKDTLLLGPFQGKPACIRIAKGRGVCGAAAERRETVIVPDVDKFPGHIACNAESRSEIVVPLLLDGTLLGVLDIDSPVLNRFDDEDARGLESLAALLAGRCEWAKQQFANAR